MSFSLVIFGITTYRKLLISPNYKTNLISTTDEYVDFYEYIKNILEHKENATMNSSKFQQQQHKRNNKKKRRSKSIFLRFGITKSTYVIQVEVIFCSKQEKPNLFIFLLRLLLRTKHISFN